MTKRIIKINGREIPVFDDELTGEEIKQMAGIPHQEQPKRQVVLQEGNLNVLVPDHEPIRITPDTAFTHHARHSKAGPATLRERRLVDEVEMLKRAFPGTFLAGDMSWVLIENYMLPAGWQPDETTILLVPPLNYPEAGPDGFYLAHGLKKRSGLTLETPGHYFPKYKNPYADAGYFWYCLEDKEGNWNSRYDSLLTFLDAIWTYLGSVPD